MIFLVTSWIMLLRCSIFFFLILERNAYGARQKFSSNLHNLRRYFVFVKTKIAFFLSKMFIFDQFLFNDKLQIIILFWFLTFCTKWKPKQNKNNNIQTTKIRRNTKSNKKLKEENLNVFFGKMRNVSQRHISSDVNNIDYFL